jgi:hypothetical protein
MNFAMRNITAQEFGASLLTWARDQFAQEVRSDFQRTKRYDGLRVKEHLAALHKQTPEQLATLSWVLPLEVFWETPDAVERRSLLSHDERQAVEKLRADYNSERDRNSHQNMEMLRRGERRDIQKLFALAVKEGNRLQERFGKEKNWLIARAGPAEWGLIAGRSWGRVAISINLAKNMTLAYDVGISNSLGVNIRFHDHYLMVLGIGAGDWVVDSEDDFSDKFLKACEFAAWHAAEYEALANRLQDD